MLKLAYVDHRIKFAQKFIEALQSAGIDFKPYGSFEEFFKENDLREFPVMICRPGLDHQSMLTKIVKDFPHIKLGLISFTEYEYCESDIPAFSYNTPESVIKWVRESQFTPIAKSL
jgi:hypothetical protein